MSVLQKEINAMLEMLPDDEQQFAYEFVKRLVLAWDPDFTKATPKERAEIEHAEQSGFISDGDIDWDNLASYAES
ncbi:MAG: hypothetical protein K2N38_08435 [Oscillospiraceae bacterium]|nr:hypothetical protein [Oscillospiraceae bacterium]